MAKPMAIGSDSQRARMKDLAMHSGTARVMLKDSQKVTTSWMDSGLVKHLDLHLDLHLVRPMVKQKVTPTD